MDIKTILHKILVFSNLIKLSHTVFALPFAFSGMIFASLSNSWELVQLFWVVVAMVGARTAAMAFNRLIDRKFDALNPRTKDRHLVRGVVGLSEVCVLIVLSSLLFVFSSFQLNRFCFYLSPLALLIVFFYSLVKRFSWGTHFFLGLALGIAPVGGWIAIAGNIELPIFVLSAGVLTWVAGFDIIYSCQDFQFDVAHKVHSIPKKFGLKKALIIAKLLHVLSFISLFSLKFIFSLNYIYTIGVLVTGAVLCYEHSLVKSDDLSRVNQAFFNMNGIISITYFLFLLGSVAFV